MTSCDFFFYYFKTMQPCAGCRLLKCTPLSWACLRRYTGDHRLRDADAAAAQASAPTDIHASRRYCDECRALHVGRVCAECGRAGCWHEVPDCLECQRPVCFESAHSVRVQGRTCCLECCQQRVDTRSRVAALSSHLPAGVVAHVGYVLQQTTRSYAAALRTRESTWQACGACGSREPETRPRHTPCVGGCLRRRRLPGRMCAACYLAHDWRCRKCTINGC